MRPIGPGRPGLQKSCGMIFGLLAAKKTCGLWRPPGCEKNMRPLFWPDPRPPSPAGLHFLKEIEGNGPAAAKKNMRPLGPGRGLRKKHAASWPSRACEKTCGLFPGRPRGPEEAACYFFGENHAASHVRYLDMRNKVDPLFSQRVGSPALYPTLMRIIIPW